jgi:hypothetical protein
VYSLASNELYFYGSRDTTGTQIFSNNLYYGNGGKPSFDSGSSTLNVDPQFTGASSSNFRLSSGSPCVNTGFNTTSIVTRDQDGYFRATNNTTDMGAYEYGAGVTQENVTAGPIEIVTAWLPNATQWQQYNQSISGQNTTVFNWTYSGTVPTNLTLGNSSSGDTIWLNGTPNTPGTFDFLVTLRNGTTALNDTQAFNVTVEAGEPINITTVSTPAGTYLTSYLAYINYTGGVGNKTLAVTTGQLPAGLSVTGINYTTGKIYGQPSAVANQTFTITCNDSYGAGDTQQYTINISDLPTGIALVSNDTATADTSGGAWSLSDNYTIADGANRMLVVAVSAEDNVTTTINRVTYNGVNLTKADMVDYYNLSGGQWHDYISQWYLASPEVGVHALTAYGTSTSGYCAVRWGAMDMQNVNQSGPVSTVNASSGSTLSQNFSITTPVDGCVVVETVSSTAGSNAQVPASGQTNVWETISSIRANGGFKIISTASTVTHRWNTSQSDYHAVIGSVFRPYTTSANQTVDPITVLTTSVPTAYYGIAYTSTLQASGGNQSFYNWSLSSGSLPSGLSLNNTTGTISGSPTALGVASFTAKVSDGSQEDTQALTLNVVSAYKTKVRNCRITNAKVH